MNGTYSPRDLLANRAVVVEALAPPVLFVAVNAAAGLAAAAIVSVGVAGGLVAHRLLRRQRLLYAVSGLGGVAVAVGFALWTDRAEAYFVPGIVSSAAMGVVSVISILVRRPLIAVMSAAVYRWPMPWYWHPRVRPAYSEVTWAWAALYLGKATLQWLLVDRGALGWLAAARVLTGWPAFALLLLATYPYITWRLRTLDAPDVDAFRLPSDAPDGEEPGVA